MWVNNDILEEIQAEQTIEEVAYLFLVLGKIILF